MTGAIGTIKDITDIEKNVERLGAALQSTIDAMAVIVESKDPYTSGHQKRVMAIAVAIAEELNLDEDKISGIRMAAMIHDIGKISVPAEILSKPGQLTDIEFGMIKAHPEAGYNILKNIEFMYPVAQIVYQHHEKMDGSGYPRGLSGNDILVEARIITVADVVEAMALQTISGHSRSIKNDTTGQGGHPLRSGSRRCLSEALRRKGALSRADMIHAQPGWTISYSMDVVIPD